MDNIKNMHDINIVIQHWHAHFLFYELNKYKHLDKLQYFFTCTYLKTINIHHTSFTRLRETLQKLS